MEAFRAAMETARDTGRAEGVIALLADDVVFRSPVVYAPYTGRAAVAPVLEAVVHVFDEFRFLRHLGVAGDSDHGFVFRGRIGDRVVEGCDFIHTGDDGLIDEFYVMVRPLSGALALVEAMQRELARHEVA